jgi:hypothetical protein
MPFSLYPLQTDEGEDPGTRVATIVLWLLQVLYTPDGTAIAEILNDHLRDLAACHDDRPPWQLARIMTTH